MWNCPRCKEPVEETFSACWNCGTARDGTRDPHFRPGAEWTDIDAQMAEPIELSDLVKQDTGDLPPIRVRFSLRPLLAVSTLIAVVSAIAAWYVQPKTSGDFFQRAVKRYDTGDNRGAISDLTRAAGLIVTEEKRSGRTAIYAIRAAAHTNLGEYQLAIDDASTALTLMGQPPIIGTFDFESGISGIPREWLHLLRANGYIELADYTRATADLNIAAKYVPSDPDLQRMLAIVKGKKSAGE